MALKHDFWSMRGHSTYRESRLMVLNASIHSISVIPVAMGTTNDDATAGTPATYNTQSRFTALFSGTIQVSQCQKKSSSGL